MRVYKLRINSWPHIIINEKIFNYIGLTCFEHISESRIFGSKDLKNDFLIDSSI